MTSPENEIALIGTHYHPGGVDALRRQEECRVQSISLKGIRLVNLQFPDSIREVDGWETVPELHNDSRKASGRKGTRKPVLSEALQRLADKARSYGLRHFGWINSDILVSQAAIDCLSQSGRECHLYSRMEFSEADGSDLKMFSGGQDCFIFTVDWWDRHRRLFRPYVVGEAYFDNVYTAITLCHSRGILYNREGLIRHADHPRLWTDSPFAEYNRCLASLDTLYWRLWNTYKESLYKIRERGGSEKEEWELQEKSFPWPPSPAARVWQWGRGIKARARYQRQQRVASKAGLLFRQEADSAKEKSNRNTPAFPQ